MSQDVRRLSVSLGSMGFAHHRPGLSNDEIGTIKDAHFDVPVVVDTYEIELTDDEAALEVPTDLRHRVQGSRYTWAIYKANSIPDPRVGTKGDIWVVSTFGGERIFVQGERSTWDFWGWDDERDSSRTKRKPAIKEMAIFHPWLRHRRLEFDGVSLQWGIVEPRWSLYMDRLNRQVRATGWPKYADISLDRVARHLCHSVPPSPNRVVVSPQSIRGVETPSLTEPVTMPTPERQKLSSTIPTPELPTPGPSQQEAPIPVRPVGSLVFRPDAFSLAKRAFPPPGLTSPIPSFTFAPFRPPVVSEEVHVKTEEEEENAVLEQLKRTRDSASPSEPQQHKKRVKTDDPPQELFTMPTSPVSDTPSVWFGPTAPLRRPTPATSPDLDPDRSGPGQDVAEFLRSLPVPMTHRGRILGELGVTSMAYLKSFAAAPQALLGDLTLKLQERGFTFMEALILRNGLSALHHEEQNAPQPPTKAQSVNAFLTGLRPSMTCHMPVFKALGVDDVHLPILEQLDSPSYEEFDHALRSKEVPWADRFLIKIALKSHPHA
ncbi:hypothetical protein C8Q78DRAFT_1076763 [Trametes maxima]|nr:hypothetical protein C8Q78DRAFT_1076763 [Trametes maxima]